MQGAVQDGAQEMVVRHITETSEPTHKAELVKNTKGYTFTVSCRNADPELAVAQAREMADLMRMNIRELEELDRGELNAEEGSK